MGIDIIIVIVLILMALLGYWRGFITGAINLVVGLAYLYFAPRFFDLGTNSLGFDNINSEVINNIAMQYIIMLLIGVIIVFVVNIILRRIIRKSFISIFDRILGMLIFLAFGYLLVCIASSAVISTSSFIPFDDSIKNSFFLSERFSDYNIISWWWSNGR